MKKPSVRLALLLGVATLGVATALSTSAFAAPPPTSTDPQPFTARAPESAFTSVANAPGPVACTRPAPDNTVSTTLHCYSPDQLRTFYGLRPLAGSNDGAGQTIVLVDAYGSPTAQQDLSFFAKAFAGPTPKFQAVFPLGSPDYSNPTGNGVAQSGPNSADGWAG